MKFIEGSLYDPPEDEKVDIIVLFLNPCKRWAISRALDALDMSEKSYTVYDGLKDNKNTISFKPENSMHTKEVVIFSEIKDKLKTNPADKKTNELNYEYRSFTELLVEAMKWTIAHHFKKFAINCEKIYLDPSIAQENDAAPKITPFSFYKSIINAFEFFHQLYPEINISAGDDSDLEMLIIDDDHILRLAQYTTLGY